MNEPTHLDLFSGIGGFALAAGWAGFRTVAFSEINDYASRVLAHHWPNVPNVGDITRWRDWPDIGPVSLVTGGFPCQPFSIAGKRRGARDERFLWPAMRDVIERYKPAWVCGENVPGIIGMELDHVLADLEGIGYRVQSLVVPACAVDARHRRDRVWILANANGNERDGSQPRADRNNSNGFQGAIETGCQRICESPELGETTADSVRLCEWQTEPGVGRVVDGVPHRVDRLRGLGNAIVPQVAFQILKSIREQII